jgi:starch synthase
MKVLYISPEAVPFAKTGGLADVAGSLPKALKEIGHDVRLYMPRYKMVDKKKYKPKKVSASMLEGVMPETDVPVYFFEDEAYFGSRDELYQVNGKDYEDNLERFAAFCKAVLAFLKEINWRPDIIHCNDWQSALVLAYLKVLYKEDPFFARVATVYSVHNIGYLGLFPKEKLMLTGLGWDQYVPDKLEFWGKIALAKAGFVYADVINTVSETYAKEIQTEPFGCGLDGLLRHRTADVYGIVNGLDYDLWNPATDKAIAKRYSTATISLKVENKYALQKLNNLPQKKEMPLIGMINRLTDQKGLDILAEIIDQMLALPCQFVVLGTGDPKYHVLLKAAKERHPENLGVNLGFDATLAELIYAGSDMFLLPSRYEPCGLGQLISFKYGTLPIVRKTGGLADTVHDFNGKTGEGEGFVFSDYNSAALFSAIKRGCDTFHKKMLWSALQEKIMQLDYSWDASAKKYVSLYMKALAKIGIAAM